MRAILSVAWLALLNNYITLPIVAAELNELNKLLFAQIEYMCTHTVSNIPLLSKEPISVLLVAANFPSHVTRIDALGEALVLRGHNVTLCSTEREGDELPKQLANRTGMTFRARPLTTAHQNKSMIQVAYEALRRQPEMARRIAKKLRSDSFYASCG